MKKMNKAFRQAYYSLGALCSPYGLITKAQALYSKYRMGDPELILQSYYDLLDDTMDSKQFNACMAYAEYSCAKHLALVVMTQVQNGLFRGIPSCIYDWTMCEQIAASAMICMARLAANFGTKPFDSIRRHYSELGRDGSRKLR